MSSIKLQNTIARLRTLQESYHKLANEYSSIIEKIDNIKLPEIDTTNIASKDLERFFGLHAALPDGYEFMTREEICAELEEIMTSMDLGLTQEMAATITNNTLNEQ